MLTGFELGDTSLSRRACSTRARRVPETARTCHSARDVSIEAINRLILQGELSDRAADCQR